MTSQGEHIAAIYSLLRQEVGIVLFLRKFVLIPFRIKFISVANFLSLKSAKRVRTKPRNNNDIVVSVREPCKTLLHRNLFCAIFDEVRVESATLRC